MAPSGPRTFSFGSIKRNASPSPPSPTFSDATQASAMNFGPNGPAKIITRANLKSSLQTYEDVSFFLHLQLRHFSILGLASKHLRKLPHSPYHHVKGHCSIRRRSGTKQWVRNIMSSIPLMLLCSCCTQIERADIWSGHTTSGRLRGASSHG